MKNNGQQKNKDNLVPGFSSGLKSTETLRNTSLKKLQVTTRVSWTVEQAGAFLNFQQALGKVLFGWPPIRQ